MGGARSGEGGPVHVMEKRFFEFLTHDERVDCLALGTIGKQPGGAKLLQAGDRPHALFVLLAGAAEGAARGWSRSGAARLRRHFWRDVLHSRRARERRRGRDDRRDRAHAGGCGHQRAFQGAAGAGGGALPLGSRWNWRNGCAPPPPPSFRKERSRGASSPVEGCLLRAFSGESLPRTALIKGPAGRGPERSEPVRHVEANNLQAARPAVKRFIFQVRH